VKCSEAGKETLTSSVDRHPGIGRPRTARTAENATRVVIVGKVSEGDEIEWP